MDNEHVFADPDFTALVYHIPLCKEGARIRLAYMEEKNGNVHVRECFVDVQFGDGILVDSCQVHSGNYGIYGNLRMHGIFSIYKWEYDKLMGIEHIAKNLFPLAMYKPLIYNESVSDYCPRCFCNICYLSYDEHTKHCKSICI